MARVLIVEDDDYHIFMIKRALMAEGHEFSSCSSSSHPSALMDMLAGSNNDLVLINRFLNHGNGWDIFNRLKEQDTQVEVMLYVLEDCNLATVKWLSASVREALLCRQKKIGVPNPLKSDFSSEIAPSQPLQ